MESGELDTPPPTLERHSSQPPTITHERDNVVPRGPTNVGDLPSLSSGVGVGARAEDSGVSGRANQDGRRADLPHMAPNVGPSCVEELGRVTVDEEYALTEQRRLSPSVFGAPILFLLP